MWAGWGGPSSEAIGVEVGGASMAGRGYLGIAGGGPEDTCITCIPQKHMVSLESLTHTVMKDKTLFTS